MARIFSIQFNYEGALQNAMVSLRSTPFFSEYAITMLDDSIAGQLPNNKIISASNDNFVFSDSTEENAPGLMKAIIQAVVEHLQMIKA